MKQKLSTLLFAVFLFFISSSQTNQAPADCKCRYPFKQECNDICTKQLLQNRKFKEVMTQARLADSTKAKLESWSNGSSNLPLGSILSKRETTKLNSAIQTFEEDPANREKSTSRFMKGIGATISVLFAKIETPGLKYNFSLEQTSFCYFPRFNLTQTDNSSFSIGAPIGVGIGIASSTFGNDAGVAFAYDLPVALDYNFGCKSTPNAYKNFGGYFGVGFGYYHVSISQSAYSDFEGTTYGPMGRAGIRFSRENWNGKGVTVGLFYKKGLEEQKLNTVGFNVLADL